MPFTPVKQVPKEPPSVRIFLTGQLMLQPDDASTSCEVFVNRSASNHHLTIEVREKRTGAPDEILMRHHGPLEFRGPDAVEGLLIQRGPTTGSVWMYTGGPSPFGDSLAAAIDLRSEGFHPSNELAVDFESARPSILIEDGVFHTASKTSIDLKMKLKKGDNDVRELPPFASLIGVNVYLNADESLNMNWREMGLSRTLQLRKPQGGTSYEIYIINDPLYQDPEEPKVHDELAQYYKVLPTVPTDDRLKLDIALPEEAATAKGSTKTPCMPVVISGP